MWPWLVKKVTKILLGLLLIPILEAKTVMIIVNLVKERMSCSKLLCYISVFSGCWKRGDNLVGASGNIFIPSWSFLPAISTKVALVDASSCGWWPRKLLLHIETETDAWLLSPIPSKQHYCLIFGKTWYFLPASQGRGAIFLKPKIKKPFAPQHPIFVMIIGPSSEPLKITRDGLPLLVKRGFFWDILYIF